MNKYHEPKLGVSVAVKCGICPNEKDVPSQ